MFNLLNFNYKKSSKNKINIYNGFSQVGSIIKVPTGYLGIHRFSHGKFKTKKGALSYIIAKNYLQK